MDTCGDVTTLLEDDNISTAIAAKLRAFLDDRCKDEKVKLAATVDCMNFFCKSDL